MHLHTFIYITFYYSWPSFRPRLSLGFYYSNERSFLHRELTEMIYWALMYAWCHGAPKELPFWLCPNAW